MLQGVVPQTVIVRGHRVTLCTAGVMAVFNQADGNTCGFCAHFHAITVQIIEQTPCLIAVSIGCHKGPAVAQRVKLPDATAVIRAEAVHPGEDAGLQGYPLRNSAEVLRPEADTHSIRHHSGMK
uniref:Uncharacterized protein n=2 Tax=Enterobacteriaceae TaxID=543 RepID=J7FN06_CITFR|nr:hypothetical protein [Citrobacter freundii]AKJ19730.1 hypothetical protein [Salmonella enterica subsp. enterica serovar Typhimurium]